MSEHENEKKSFKGDIIRLCASAVLLIAAFLLNRFLKPAAYISVALFLLPYLAAGIEVIKEAALGIIKGEIFDENFLMFIASVGAFIIGEYTEAVLVMLFFGVGELFEEIAADKNRRSVKALLDIRPDTATVIKSGAEKSVSAREVAVGDTVKVTAGERIPLDGIIIKGETSTDNSAVTGESRPISASVGAEVFSGCINLSGVIEIKVTKSFDESTASKILSLVENSSESKAKSERFIKKFAKIYTPAVCIAAVLLAVVPSLIFGNTRQYVYRALTFLVVSCPCALVVSVPLAYFSGIASAAKKGILIKGARYLEAITRVSSVFFDKTGTLTSGSFEIISINPESISEQSLLILAASAESGSNHPISVSLKAKVKECDIIKPEKISETAGKGVSAVIDGSKVLVGNASFMEQNGIEHRKNDSADTVIYIAKDGEFSGSIILGDKIKSTSKDAVDFLKSEKIKTYMLTGDRGSIANKVSENLALDGCFAELKPEDKVDTLKRVSCGKVCAFVGDGINDAPVLTAADVGIAMGALGSDAAIDAADVVLMEDDPLALKKALTVSKRTQKIVKQNIIMSLAVKFGILLLGSLGLLVTDMWIALFGDVGILIIAVLNAVRALK